MFENILFQNATALLSDDIKKGSFPRSVLFSGPSSSGKMSCALEVSRVLSCKKEGKWDCECSNCLKSKAMIDQNVLILGAGEARLLEIAAAKKTLIEQNNMNSRHLEASRFLYLRAVRKLTSKFNPILWEGDDKLSKFAPILQGIEENLELLEPKRVVPDPENLSKILDEIEKSCEKLSSSFLYGLIPVLQIRNFSSWAHLSSTDGKKVIIIENAELMADSSRNALLKILEEPPEDVIFILTTTQKSSLLPTILSRLRVYNFLERTEEEMKTVIDRIFHTSFKGSSLSSFFYSFLKVKPETIKKSSTSFFSSIVEGRIPDIKEIVSSCESFSPKVLMRLFMASLIDFQKDLKKTQRGSEASYKILSSLRTSLNNFEVFNQSPSSCLEELSRNLLQIDYITDGVFKDELLFQKEKRG